MSSNTPRDGGHRTDLADEQGALVGGHRDHQDAAEEA
jgi:hypothetical protein